MTERSRLHTAEHRLVLSALKVTETRTISEKFRWPIRRCLVFCAHIPYITHPSTMPPIGIKLVRTPGSLPSLGLSKLSTTLFFGEWYWPNLLQETPLRDAITVKSIYRLTPATSWSNNGEGKRTGINGNRCTGYCFQEKQFPIRVCSATDDRLHTFH